MRVSDKHGHVYIRVSVVHESSSQTTHRDKGRGLQLKGSGGGAYENNQAKSKVCRVHSDQRGQEVKGWVSHPEVLQQ